MGQAEVTIATEVGVDTIGKLITRLSIWLLLTYSVHPIQRKDSSITIECGQLEQPLSYQATQLARSHLKLCLSLAMIGEIMACSYFLGPGLLLN